MNRRINRNINQIQNRNEAHLKNDEYYYVFINDRI